MSETAFSTLGEVTSILTGFPFESDHFSEEGTFRLLRGSNVKRSVIDWSPEISRFWSDTSKDVKKYELAQNDVVIAMDGALVGRSYAKIASSDLPCLLVQRVARLRCESPDDAEYVYQVVQSAEFSKKMDSVKTNTAIPHISAHDISTFGLRWPNKEERRAIAGVLSTWDRRIQQLTDLIAAKLSFKQGLMQQLLTGKRRFPGFKEDWNRTRIGEIATEVSERNGHEPAIPVLSCTKYDGLVDSLEYFGKRVFSENTENYKVVRRNEFAYATNHIEEGSIGLLTEHEAGLVSPMYTVFRLTGKVLPAFLFRLLKTETYRQIFQSFTSASVNRRGSLRWKQFSTIPLLVPGTKEQERITSALSVFDREIDLLQKQLDALKQQKKGLMQKLLTGSIRVRGAL